MYIHTLEIPIAFTLVREYLSDLPEAYVRKSLRDGWTDITIKSSSEDANAADEILVAALQDVGPFSHLIYDAIIMTDFDTEKEE